jgi:hypothetical protein
MKFYVDKIIQRSNLIQSLEDIKRTAENQIEDILLMMDNFEHQGSNWVIVRPLDFKFRFIRYKNGFKRARGFIPTPSWFHNRRAIINIQNKDENCFFKCIYRYFNRDKHRNDHRDIPMDVVNKFFEQNQYDKSVFTNGITTEALRSFEQSTKIGINIYYIDPRGPEFTRHEYVSMFNDDNNYDPVVNLGYMEEDDKCHFVLVTKLNCLMSEKYHSHKKLICTTCNTVFSTREALLNHEKIYHSDRQLPIINLPSYDKAFINFDITRETDLKKTIWYPFVCYADFEASTKVVDGKIIQVPNSYVIFSPDLTQLTTEEVCRDNFLKSY